MIYLSITNFNFLSFRNNYFIPFQSTNTVKLPGTDPKRVGMVTLDMRALDRKSGDGKPICDIPKLVKAEVRAGLEDVLHRKSVS